MASIDDVLATATARRERVRLCLRADLLDRRDVLGLQLRSALGDDEAAVQIAEAVQQVEAEIREATTEFVLQALPRRAREGQCSWEDLLAAHPPTDKQKAGGADFNPDTFPSAAIAACCVEPTGMTPEKFDELEGVIGYGEWQALWSACLAANVVKDRLGESVVASAVLARWRRKSEQPSLSVSPEASFSDG